MKAERERGEWERKRCSAPPLRVLEIFYYAKQENSQTHRESIAKTPFRRIEMSIPPERKYD